MASLSILDPLGLRPYASFAVLVYTGPTPSAACTQLRRQVEKLATRSASGRETKLLARGLPDGWLDQALPDSGDSVSTAVEVFAHRVRRTPSWAKSGSPFTNTTEELSVIFQRGDLLAVSCARSLVDALQRWLDKPPRPPFERVPAGILQQAVLDGDARGLWLRGTHRRQRTKADTKNLSGVALGDALDPFDDSSFALTSGRVAVDPARALSATTGTLGTTPRKAWVWNAPTDSLEQFVEIASEVLELVAAAMSSPSSDAPFPELAVEMDSLSGVTGAFDAYLTEPEEVAQLPDATTEQVHRADLLRDVLLDVVGTPTSANFTIVVGRSGAEAGRLRCRPRIDRGHVYLDIGLDGAPSDSTTTAAIRDALEDGDLLNVYFESGHVLARGALTAINRSPITFRNWVWQNFGSYSVQTEKPVGAAAQAIHDAIGGGGDVSLFSWVASSLAQGHLTCDDGSNEVADFVHLAHNGDLMLIHVKAAGAGSSRRVAAGAFELVVSQAIKNLRYLDAARLGDRIAVSPISRPATWVDGKRVADRTQLLSALTARPPDATSHVVIVQPHITESTVKALRLLAASGGTSQDLLRLQLVESLLTSGRGSAVGLGCDLVVWGSQ